MNKDTQILKEFARRQSVVVNWWQMDGLGDTKEEAYADLESKFAKLKDDGSSLPRPGTGLPIEFASRERVSRYDDIAEDFFRRVLDKDYRECWISDQSSLWDFHGEESNEHLHRRVWETYRVDVSDIASGNLVEIFEELSETLRRHPWTTLAELKGNPQVIKRLEENRKAPEGPEESAFEVTVVDANSGESGGMPISARARTDSRLGLADPTGQPGETAQDKYQGRVAQQADCSLR